MALIRPHSTLITILLIVGIIIAASYTFVGGFGSFPQNGIPNTTGYQVSDPSGVPANYNLQLRSPIFTTVAPTPSPTPGPTPTPTPSPTPGPTPTTGPTPTPRPTHPPYTPRPTHPPYTPRPPSPTPTPTPSVS